MKNKIFIITGPSGAGKTEVVNLLLKNKNLNLIKLITCTTRSKRENEIQGKDYFFLSKQEFEKEIETGNMFEWAKVYENYYGSRKNDVENILNSGNNVLLVLDIQGAISFQKKIDCKVIFLNVESLEELEKRIKNRGTDSSEVIEKRMNQAEKEIEIADNFDKKVVNKTGKLDETVKEIEEYIFSQNNNP